MSFKELNEKFNFNGKSVLCVGGTKGIGAGIATRFAQLGANVSIAGRSAETATQMLEQLAKNAKNIEEQKFKYFKVDCSSASSLSAFIAEVKTHYAVGGLDYLVQSQGDWTSGDIGVKSEDGLDKRFSIVCFSKFNIAYQLTPVLKEASLFVFGPRKSGSIDLNDVELSSNNSFWTAAGRDGAFLDSMTMELQTHDKKGIRYFHVKPGVVKTDLVKNSNRGRVLQGVMSLANSMMGQDPVEHANLEVYLVSQATHGGRYDEKGRLIRDYSWIEDENNRKQLWDWTYNKSNALFRLDSSNQQPPSVSNLA